MDALLRRRMMMSVGSGPGPGPEPPTYSYVTDGLVMHLDGINKGQTSGRWESLVGSTYYTLNSHSTSEANAVVMDGAGVLTGTNGVAIGGQTGTVDGLNEG